MAWVIDAAARKHGVSNADITHAADHPIAHGHKDDAVIVVGADNTGQLMEIVIIDENHIIHAMRPARQSILRLVGLIG